MISQFILLFFEFTAKVVHNHIPIMLAHKSNGKKLKPAGFSRTASGKLNAQMSYGKEIIEIDTSRQV